MKSWPNARRVHRPGMQRRAPQVRRKGRYRSKTAEARAVYRRDPGAQHSAVNLIAFEVHYLQHGATGPPRGRRGLSGRNALPHAPLQADRDQLLCLDRELHRQVLQHVPDEAIDNQSRCFLSR
jgi:hypothetical protein